MSNIEEKGQNRKNLKTNLKKKQEKQQKNNRQKGQTNLSEVNRQKKERNNIGFIWNRFGKIENRKSMRLRNG